MELHLPAYTTAPATPDPSCVCDLHHSSRQRWILGSLSEASDRTYNLMVPRRIRFCCATMGTPREARLPGTFCRIWLGWSAHSSCLQPGHLLEKICWKKAALLAMPQSRRSGHLQPSILGEPVWEAPCGVGIGRATSILTLSLLGHHGNSFPLLRVCSCQDIWFSQWSPKPPPSLHGPPAHSQHPACPGRSQSREPQQQGPLGALTPWERNVVWRCSHSRSERAWQEGHRLDSVLAPPPPLGLGQSPPALASFSSFVGLEGGWSGPAGRCLACRGCPVSSPRV